MLAKTLFISVSAWLSAEGTSDDGWYIDDVLVAGMTHVFLPIIFK